MAAVHNWTWLRNDLLSYEGMSIVYHTMYLFMKVNKFSEDQCMEKCRSIGVQYVGFHRDIKKGTIVEYICSNHPDKGTQYCDWSHFKNQKRSCPYCYGRYKTTADVQRSIIKDDIGQHRTIQQI